MFSNLFSITLPNIGKYFLGIHFFRNLLSKKTLLSSKQTIINGNIPPFITSLKNLGTLVLSNNLLSGNINIPWEEMSLSHLDLSRNNLFGDIPDSICFSPYLQVLKLLGNNFSGELSPSLQNCTGLILLDVGENRLSGSITEWVGDNLSILSALGLRGSMFSGNIPGQLCRLPHLDILDLAHNHLSSFIPTCLGNLSGLQAPSFYEQDPPDFTVSYRQSMDLIVKGRQLEYNLTLGIVNVLDLSSNNLKGEIPEEIINLTYLGTLNLSWNQLTGKIPDKIGSLQRLETLDLSNNHLSGPIPPSLSSMTFLNHLNLSYTNLSGPIPSTNQFQTFDDPSIYEGNSQLRGSPLPTNCSVPEFKDDEVEDGDDGEMLWFYLGMAAGFSLGFWVVCGTLIMKKSWKRAYFQFVDETKDKIFVAIAVCVARLRR